MSWKSSMQIYANVCLKCSQITGNSRVIQETGGEEHDKFQTGSRNKAVNRPTVVTWTLNDSVGVILDSAMEQTPCCTECTRRLITWIHTWKGTFFILWPWTLTYDVNLWTWPRPTDRRAPGHSIYLTMHLLCICRMRRAVKNDTKINISNHQKNWVVRRETLTISVLVWQVQTRRTRNEQSSS